MRISDWSSDVCSSDLGGFNIFPSDLEAILIADDRVVDAAVVGIPSEEWGETPVAFVVLKDDADAEAVRADCNAKVGKTQRLSAIRVVDELPRSPIGKVLKRELRDAYAGRSEEHTSELQSLM